MFSRSSLAGFLSVGLALTASATRADELQFNRDIRPILAAKCFACHGFDAKTREADLRLDVAESALAPRDGRPAITASDLAQSGVWHRITSKDPDVVMPPPATKKELTAAEIATIKAWIVQGAPYQQHWSFEAPVAIQPPTILNGPYLKNDIDRFLIPPMLRAGLNAREEADRSTLIRRVAFTLTGLPPSLDEVEAYLADQSPAAYEHMVDRYLDSPRYGEEMARHWLDIARYADTHGLHLDNEREMWAYRDWVIEAFNRNLPFDEFTIEQLAGDLLPNATKDQKIATGFNRCNVTTSEGGSIAEEFLYRYAVERASTTTQAWMGLTGGCAVCHDHKFDPISTKEFYSLYAFFYDSADPAMDGNIRFTNPFMSLATPTQEQTLKQLREREAAAKKELQRVIASVDYQDPSRHSVPAPAYDTTDVWFDDVLPTAQRVSTTSRNKATWTRAADEEFEIPSGVRALRQYGGDLYQDKFDNLAQTWVIPHDAVIDVWVRTDPLEPPAAMMLELNTSRGVRRLVLGDNSQLGGGGAISKDRLHRELPTPGQWLQVSIAASDWNLKPDDIVKSLSFEEFGGICWWDRLQVRGKVPVPDARSSFHLWWTSRRGLETAGISGKLAELLQAGPPATNIDSAADALSVENSAANRESQKLQGQLLQHFFMYDARPIGSDWQHARTAYDAAVAERAALEDSIPGTFIFTDLPKPRDAFVMMRGQYDKPGDPVEPSVPAFLPALKLPEGRTRANRLDLARWLVSEEHPLTARVAVNRLWQQVFGVGLVKTSDDFGSQGEPPTNPELLDWLAVWYRNNGWDTKKLMKLLVTSAAYRRDSSRTPHQVAKDPENRWLSYGPRLRLDAEQIRDNALFVSGLINLKMGGPGVKFYQPPNIWEPVGYGNSNTRYFIQDHGDDLYRRSIYSFLKRTAPPPFMSNFDGPNREQLCARRERSNTPLQALQTLNDPQHIEAARAFAERLLTEGGSVPSERIEFAYRTVLARPADDQEIAIVSRALQSYINRYASDRAAAEQLLNVGESPIKVVANPQELAAYTLLANLILNLDETLNRN